MLSPTKFTFRSSSLTLTKSAKCSISHRYSEEAGFTSRESILIRSMILKAGLADWTTHIEQRSVDWWCNTNSCFGFHKNFKEKKMRFKKFLNPGTGKKVLFLVSFFFSFFNLSFASFDCLVIWRCTSLTGMQIYLQTSRKPLKTSSCVCVMWSASSIKWSWEQLRPVPSLGILTQEYPPCEAGQDIILDMEFMAWKFFDLNDTCVWHPCDLWYSFTQCICTLSFFPACNLSRFEKEWKMELHWI